jgi:hypothetical protein
MFFNFLNLISLLVFFSPPHSKKKKKFLDVLLLLLVFFFGVSTRQPNFKWQQSIDLPISQNEKNYG